MLRNAVVLLSGGLDSTTVLALAQERGFECHALSFNYGQRHYFELSAALKVARAAGVTHRTVRVEMPWATSALVSSAGIAVPKGRADEDIAHGIPVTYVPARNTIFLAYALSFAESLDAADIFLGVNALDYSGYPDCRPDFVASFQATARLGTKAGAEGSEITIHAPLVKMTKADIIREGVRLGIDYGMTLSCYDPPGGQPCGSCDSCQLRARGFRDAGVVDPTARAA